MKAAPWRYLRRIAAVLPPVAGLGLNLAGVPAGAPAMRLTLAFYQVSVILLWIAFLTCRSKRNVGILMIFTEEDYPSWKTIAEDARQALIVLHHDVPQCLPGEPGACGGTFAEHTIAYLATLRARVDFEIEHLGQAAQPAIQVIYRNMITEIRAREDCGDPEHQPVPGKEA